MLYASTLAAVALVSGAAAHVNINYPTSSWNFTEEQQETGAFCGGGVRSTAAAWGTESAFISLSGDAGNFVTVLFGSTNTTTARVDVVTPADFPITLASNVTIPESGNLCLNLVIPQASEYITGSHGTIYVAAADGSETVSSCAEVVLVPTNLGTTSVIQHGAPVINPTTGGQTSTYEFYCSNSTIAALDTCSCHCHGTSEHCDESCSADRIATAATECAAAASGSGSTTVVAATSLVRAAASTASGSIAAASTSGPTGTASHQVAFGGVAALLALAVPLLI